MAFYVLLVGVLGAVLTPIGTISQRSMEDSAVFSHAGERNRVALTRIAQEVRRALTTTVAVLDGGRTLALTLPNGFDGANIIPGDTIEYRLSTAAGEVPNGVDDNQNGLVDEGDLVRRNTSTGEEVLLNAALDVGASGFALNGGAVTITVSTHGQLADGASTFQVSRNITVFPRN